MNVSKASQILDIPIRLIKLICDNFSDFICAKINTIFEESISPEQLKPNIKPVFKKNSLSEKENYRPVSILSNTSKIHERCMDNQLHDYLDIIVSENSVALE